MASIFVLNVVGGKAAGCDLIGRRGSTEGSGTTLSLNVPGTSKARSLCGGLWRNARVFGGSGVVDFFKGLLYSLHQLLWEHKDA